MNYSCGLGHISIFIWRSKSSPIYPQSHMRHDLIRIFWICKTSLSLVKENTRRRGSCDLLFNHYSCSLVKLLQIHEWFQCSSAPLSPAAGHRRAVPENMHAGGHQAVPTWAQAWGTAVTDLGFTRQHPAADQRGDRCLQTHGTEIGFDPKGYRYLGRSFSTTWWDKYNIGLYLYLIFNYLHLCINQ